MYILGLTTLSIKRNHHNMAAQKGVMAIYFIYGIVLTDLDISIVDLETKQ